MRKYLYIYCTMTYSISSRSFRLEMDLMELNKLNVTEPIHSTQPATFIYRIFSNLIRTPI